MVLAGQPWVALPKILRWGPAVQGLMRSEMIVDPFPLLKGLGQRGDPQVPIIDFVELLGMGPVGPPHMTVELGGMGWQDKKADAPALVTPPPSVLTPNLDRAAELLRDLPALWQHPGVEPRQKMELAREVFQEIRLREGQLVAVRPRTAYIPLFAHSLWRQDVVGDPRSS